MNGRSAGNEKNVRGDFIMYEHLLMEEKGPVAVVAIHNPKSLNALNSATLSELNACLGEIEKQIGRAHV